ncbi:hypothetical protein [Phnomibacter ginsenosidimutans]|uniref:DUF3575 domain-containing protein n=1 Tax=Phnomibacter ginsenosidimutans TaxID=2676868 RepID=A0A6I6GYC3_9BACT|nr:hypothetical protein [Phnomibacter ginsenosidimutans]QGW27511.1 hypothetical protein GLV81_04830 [Phnomibacter ginsenosidimutans]
MQKKNLWIVFALVLAANLQVNAQNNDSTYKKWYVGSTLYLLGNLTEKHNPKYIQVNVGYRITPKDVIHIRFKKSEYDWPLGTPWKNIFDGTEDTYPGHARILAPTVGYQRFWWKGAFTSVYALNAFEKYMDVNNRKIGNGYTLYLDFYLGYQFKFFKDRFFFEPSIGCSYWPVRTNVPASFKAVEKKWNNYFIQPGFDFGYNFNVKRKKLK